MNRIMATCQNGCFGKLDDHSVHTILNHHPTEMDVLQRTLDEIILLICSSPMLYKCEIFAKQTHKKEPKKMTTFAFSSFVIDKYKRARAN